MEETFSKTGVNKVSSSLGFTVETLGLVGIRYTDATHDLEVYAEGLSSVLGYVLYTSSLPEDPDERKEIIGNIQRSFDFRGFVLQLI